VRQTIIHFIIATNVKTFNVAEHFDSTLLIKNTAPYIGRGYRLETIPILPEEKRNQVKPQVIGWSGVINTEYGLYSIYYVFA